MVTGIVDRSKDGFGVSVGTAALAPVLAAVFLMGGMWVFIVAGDWRTSPAPWLMAAVPTSLVATCLGLVRVHGRRSVTFGGLWTASALLGIAGFFLAVGIGGLTGLQDLPEGELGLLAWLPIIGFGFGFFSMTPALVITAIGAGRAGILPRWGTWALWFVAPLLVVTFIVGGEGPEVIAGAAAPVGMILLAVGWIVIGRSLRRLPTSRRRGAAPSARY